MQLYLAVPFMRSLTQCQCNEQFIILIYLFAGFGPWVLNISSFSIRIKIISILFYVTWFSIRCFIYPIILKTLWFKWKDSGAIFHTRYSMALFLHIIFCLLNFKVRLSFAFTQMFVFVPIVKVVAASNGCVSPFSCSSTSLCTSMANCSGHLICSWADGELWQVENKP